MTPPLYLDTSALAKLVIDEPGSGELRSLLGDHQLVSSSIAQVELIRAARRVGTPQHVRVAAQVLQTVSLVRTEGWVLARAATLDPPELRSLDAIHLATALRVRTELTFLTYDRQLGQAARDLGLPVVSPGV